MKKWFSKIVSVAMLFVMILSLLPQRAEAAGSSFEGDDDLWAGDRVSVTFYVTGSNLYGIDVSLSYDSSRLEWLGVSQEIGGSWNLEQNGSSILLWDSKMSSPINGWTAVFSATFRVRDGVSPGSVVSASVSGTASDGSSDSSLGTSYWEAEILAPLSGNADLDDLWCGNADLDFTGGTEYSITVPYEVTELDLDWSCEHGGAWGDVSGNSLSVGSNTVTVTVTAENGNTKRYYIYVTREQDPNYVPSKDATLSALSVSKGQLSPSFSPDVLDYVVYLPNEISEITLSGTASDSKAYSVEQVGGATLLDGNNLVSVKCTAEDQTTVKEYKVTVIRMPAYAGVLPEIIPPVTGPVIPEPEPVPTLEIPTVLDLPVVGEVPLLWVVIGAGAILLLIVIFLLLIVWFAGKQVGLRKAEKAAVSPAVTASAPSEEAAEEETVSPDEATPDESGAEEESSVEEPSAEEASAEEPSAEEVPVEEIPSEKVSTEDAAVEQEAAEELPVAESAVEDESHAQDVSSAEAEEVGRMSLTELLDDIRGM